MAKIMSLGSVSCVHILDNHGLGDVIMSFPLLEEVARQFPNVVISLTVKSQLERKVVSLFLGERLGPVLCLSELRSMFMGSLVYLIQLRRLAPDVIVTCFGIEPNKAAILSYLSGARYRVGLPIALGRILSNCKVFPPQQKHKVFQNLALLTAIKKDVPENPCIKLKLPEDSIAKSEEILKIENGTKNAKKYIGIAPGSGIIEKHKRWPIKHFITLIERVLEEIPQTHIVLFGNKAEQSLSDEIKKSIKSSYSDRLLDTTGQFDIKITAALLSNMNVVIVNCTGIAHLAAAVGTYVIGLYGPTDPDLTGPFTKDLTIVRLGLECSPCYRRGYISGCGSPRCISEIPVDEVFAALLSVPRKKEK